MRYLGRLGIAARAAQRAEGASVAAARMLASPGPVVPAPGEPEAMADERAAAWRAWAEAAGASAHPGSGSVVLLAVRARVRVRSV